MNTNTYFEIQDGSSTIGVDGNYRFATQESAAKVASHFKQNPRSHNENMTDESVNYWKNKTLVIVKKTIQTEELQTI